MQQAVLCIPVVGDPVTRILLGYKKTGFGAGKFTGVGGKVEPGESVETAVLRELAEETSLQATLTELQPRGEISFFFPAKPAWNLFVTLFLLWQWQGQAQESREIRPHWFTLADIPYSAMWADGRFWLPPVLAGQSVRASFTFAADNETVKHHEIQVY